MANKISIGTIKAWNIKKDKIPFGWLACDGRLVSTFHYCSLFRYLNKSKIYCPKFFQIPNLNKRITQKFHQSFIIYAGITAKINLQLHTVSLIQSPELHI